MKNNDIKVYSFTMAVCPKCKKKIRARIVKKDKNVFLDKFCDIHGHFSTLISTDIKWYEESVNYIKPGQQPLKKNVEIFKGCPDSCGFCPEHQQHTCLPIIEITDKCELDCPICLKNFKKPLNLSISEFSGIIDNLIKTEGTMDVINLSGGEAVLHQNFEEFIDIAIKKGISQISVSTNGLELKKNKKLRGLFKSKELIAAIQFDGFLPETYEFLRGKDLSAEKIELLKILENEKINYSLVSTIAKGINDKEIKNITDYFFKSEALSLMFQPIVFTGNAITLDESKYRLTVPDVVHSIETSKYVNTGDFNPLPCSHFSCFALSYYLKLENNEFYSLKEFLGKENYLEVCKNKTLPGLDSKSYSLMKNRLYNLWSAADSSALNEKVLTRVKKILRLMGHGEISNKEKINLGIENMKAIFIHNFMDIHSMDFERLIKCCNPYPQTGDRLVPMCAQNVFFS